MVLGVAFGLLRPDLAKADWMAAIANVFLRLISSIVAPLIFGMLVAGIAVGVLENVIPGYVDPLVGGGTRDLVAATVILLTILVRPFGLFGREDIERV